MMQIIRPLRAQRDLARIDAAAWRDAPAPAIALAAPVRSLVQCAPAAEAALLTEEEIAKRYPERALEERTDGVLLSFFMPDAPHNRHVVLRDKERIATRRHGAILRSGQAMLPDESTLCATAWMHGVFAAQLTIGNTSFHKLFSVSRDPYNITRASGLRMLVDIGEGWRLLAIPSVFEMGLSYCRWIYSLGARLITISAIASGDDAAMLWRIAVEGEPCRFLIFGHLTLGEREFDHASRVELDEGAKRFSFRPDPDWLWGQRYPQAVYHLVSSTPEAIEAIGGDEFLYVDGVFRGGAYAAIRTAPTRDFRFAVIGSMTSAAEADALAAEFSHPIADQELLEPARCFWRKVTRGLRIDGDAALDALFPWLAQNAMIHLTVPHGLEQYTGAAWGTRDVCQGPVEFLLALRHDEPVKEILRLVFAQQYELSGDWPQWFMLDPYAIIQDRVSHGDVIVWPLKALNDYIEATGDFAFLDEPVTWRGDDLERTARKDSVAAISQNSWRPCGRASLRGTHLIRYGEGDWNDSLQPVDPAMRDAMASSWTVALLFQQFRRAAEIYRRSGRTREARGIRRARRRHAGRLQCASDARRDRRGLCDLRAGRRGSRTAAASDRQAHRAQLFAAADDARDHRRPVHAGADAPSFGAYRRTSLVSRRGAADGPAGCLSRRPADDFPARRIPASFFGREIGLMYVHAHLRYGEAMAVLGDAGALFDALGLVNPVAIGDRLDERVAAPAQRLLQQLRRSLSRPRQRERRVGVESGPARSDSKVAGGFIQAGPGSSRTSSSTACSARQGSGARPRRARAAAAAARRCDGISIRRLSAALKKPPAPRPAGAARSARARQESPPVPERTPAGIH